MDTARGGRVERMIGRSALASLWIPLALALAGWGALAPGEARGEDRPQVFELTPVDEAAIEKGLARLAAMQSGLTGNFGDRYKVASTSLAGLALLASGDGYERGRHGRAIAGAVSYLLSDSVKRGVRGRPTECIFVDGDPQQQGRTHAHGFAMLFLAEVYGQTARDPEIAAALRGAIQATLAAQTALGGWGYHFRGEPEFGEDEASVTVTQVQALRAARNAGFHVPLEAITRALGYLRASMTAEGACRYSLTMGGEERKRTSYELTAAAVSTLNAGGMYLGAGGTHAGELERGLAFLRRTMRLQGYKEPSEAATDFYFYGNLYAAQAMFQATDDDWAFWFPRVRQAILDKQKPDGRWESPRNFGESYATASALLILQMPRRYLPILQR